MTENRFALVEFQGDQLLTIFDGETVRVAMKPLVERLGIAWPRQFQKLKEDPVLSRGVTLTVIPSERGAQETLTLPIDLMQGWLFKLNPERVAPEARDRVIAYQAECYQVLHDYWTKGAAINPRFGGQSAATAAEAIKLLDAIKREPSAAGQELLHRMLDQVCKTRGLETPPLVELLPPPCTDDAEADRILQQIDALLTEQPDLDHHRRDDLIAIRRRDVAAQGIPMPKPILPAIRRHPRFMGERTVNGRHGTTAHCWVFRPAP